VTPTSHLSIAAPDPDGNGRPAGYVGAGGRNPTLTAFQAFEDVGRTRPAVGVLNLPELYSLAFASVGTREVTALRLAKFVAMVGATCDLGTTQRTTPFLNAIWLYGIEPAKDTQLIKRHPLLDKSVVHGTSPRNRPVFCKDPSALATLVERFSPEPASTLRKLALAIEPLSDDELIGLSYDVVLGRPFPDGSGTIRNVQEALSPLVFDTLVKNLWSVGRYYNRSPLELRVLDIPADGRPFDLTTPSTIPIDGVTCLKNGTVNYLVAYQALLLIQSSNVSCGLRNVNLTRLLSCRLLSPELDLRFKVAQAAEKVGCSPREMYRVLQRPIGMRDDARLGSVRAQELGAIMRQVDAQCRESTRNVGKLFDHQGPLSSFLSWERGRPRVVRLPQRVGPTSGKDWYARLVASARQKARSLESLRDSFAFDPMTTLPPSQVYAYVNIENDTRPKSAGDSWARWGFSG